jgi:hypothetical protein
MSNPYLRLGFFLAITGFALLLISYLIAHSIPLSAIGLSTMILGIISITLSSAQFHVSPDIYQIFLKTELRNTSAILKGLEINNKAIYLPCTASQNISRVIIPLDGNINIGQIQEYLRDHKMVKRQFNSKDAVIAITTPGNVSLELLNNKPGQTVEQIKSALDQILIGKLGIAKKVEVDRIGSRLYIFVSGAQIRCEDPSYSECLGSPIASIAAAISSEALEKPIRIIEENNFQGIIDIKLEILS